MAFLSSTPLRLLGPATIAAVLAACSPSGPGHSTNDNLTDPGPSSFTTVFTVVFENHDYDKVVGSSDAPYINSLISQYGLATNYSDSGTHPSLPNYLYMISGNTQYPGLFDVDPTFFQFPVKKDNLGNQLQVAGVPWRSYQESMGTPCLLKGSGNYAPRHDPFLYFDDIQHGPNGLCAQTSVDYSNFAGDLAAGTYRYMWITPNLLDDGHNPQTDPSQGLRQSDAWLSTEIPKILASQVYQSGGVIFLTWDEGEASAGDHVPMIIISPKLKSPGYRSSTPYSHASFLATVEEIFNLPKLGDAAKAQSMMEFFDFSATNGGQSSTATSSSAAGSGGAGQGGAGQGGAGGDSAQTAGGTGGGSSGSDCCTPAGTPGCAFDQQVSDCVCAVDSYCCSTAWDQTCVDEIVSSGCGTCP